MFTGIIETIAIVTDTHYENGQLQLTLKTEIARELSVDQSVAHDGICLTVTSVNDEFYTVTAIDETLQKTTVGQWTKGKKINLERAMILGARLDGHLVQGHVDGLGVIKYLKEEKGSHIITVMYDERFAAYIIEKGSIGINGISLTCFQVTKNSFQVAIIPYTWQHTNFRDLQINDNVNLEFDVIGKYLVRRMELNENI